jgi:hypothetical protein
LNMNGTVGSVPDAEVFAQTEPLLPDWSEISGSSVSAEEAEVSTPLSATKALVTSKQLESSNPFMFLTAPPDWLGHSSNIGLWNAGFMNPFEQQIIPRAAKAFWPKGIKWRQLSLVRKFVLSTLKTFPSIMLLDGALPPFIHPMCMTEERLLPESLQPGPLSRCAGIMALWSTRNKNNKHYIWKIIRMEQERISEDTHTYQDWTAVAALQAIVMYTLLRISAEDDEDADFDVPLIQTMIKLTRRVKGITVKYCDPASRDPPTWEHWTLVESLRRTISTLFIIEFLFDISAGTDDGYCNSSKYWSEMSLPSAKQLWQAQTRAQWEQEYRASNGDPRPTFGELLRHDDVQSQARGLLDSWMGQVDEFGALVIGAASLADAELIPQSATELR